MKKLNRILTVNVLMSFVPLLQSVLVNVALFMCCMAGEEISNVDGYQVMGIIIGGFFIYMPIWMVAILIYIVLLAIMFVYACIAWNANDRQKKGTVVSAHKAANAFFYVMSVWSLLYSGFTFFSYMVLAMMFQYSMIITCILSFFGFVMAAMVIAVVVFTVLQTTYISQYKDAQMQYDKIPKQYL